MMKQRVLWWVLPALALMVGGCAPSDTGPSFGNIGRNFADDWTGARAFDSATADLSRGNLEAIQAAGRALDARIQGGSRGSLNVAAAWMAARLPSAMGADIDAENSDAGTIRDQFRREANVSYRAALAFLPSDETKWRDLSPDTLNALGYFLAERGQSRAEFARAEKLTSLAIELSPARNSADRYSRAQGPTDSHAWALFRLGQTNAALAAQAEVIATLGENAKKYGAPGAEVAYHWGAICRAAGREEDARAAFKYALSQNPPPELREIIEANLSGVLA